MIITLSGVTGAGKSFFKKEIQKRLKFDNQIIYTTRPKREGEIEGIDKFFVSEEEFKNLEKQGKIIVTFEYLGNKYGYQTEKMKSNSNSIIELHYKIIYRLKKEVDDVFAIYIIPKSIDIAKQNLKNRKIEKNQEELRLKEIDEQAEEFKNNKEIQKQFDYILYNNYDEDSIERLINIIKERLIKI